MNQYIFRTNIANKTKLKPLKSIFNDDINIIEWSIDLEDIDKVLKINTIESTTENQVIDLIKDIGFNCEALPD